MTSLSNVLRWTDQAQTLRATVIPVPDLSPAAPGCGSKSDDEGHAALAVVAAAHEEAARVLAEARAEAETLRHAAREDGLAAARAQLEAERATQNAQLQAQREAWEQERAAQLAEIEALAEGVQRDRIRIVERALRPLPNLCAAVVRDILHRELVLAPADVQAMVQDMLRYVMDTATVEVRVHPADYAAAAAACPAWRSASYGRWELVVVPDESVGRGGCELRTESGRLDGRLAVKLELLQQELDAVFGSEGAVTDDE
ncbi:MAG: hypothetical protein K6T78_07610 [Alicyclobacillus sp.]|nr:hypothetical protein [Alicyclobacillus sp.]